MRQILLQLKRRKERGFTLVETLIAIFILLLAITGPMSVAYQSVKFVRLAADRSVATQLAQDAMEYIVAKKNFNIASGDDWMNDLYPAKCKSGGASDKGCTIDTSFQLDDVNAVQKCTGPNGCPPLQHNGDYYGYNGGADTKFTRTITIEAPSNNLNERIIKVEVEYSSGIFKNSYELRLNVFESNV